MRRRFVTCDVFTDTLFGGNPLAVVLDAEGLSDAQMQQVAREFNYSETTFVLPAEHGHDRRVRIFTPSARGPVRGASERRHGVRPGLVGRVRSPRGSARGGVRGGRRAGARVGARRDGDRIWCELQAPEALSLGPELPVAAVAEAVGLTPQDIATDRHRPRVASVGLEFIVAELADRSALERARPDEAALQRLVALGASTPDIHLYVSWPTRPTASTCGRACSHPSTGLLRTPQRAAPTAPWSGCSPASTRSTASGRGGSPRGWRWAARASWRRGSSGSAARWPACGSAAGRCWSAEGTIEV